MSSTGCDPDADNPARPHTTRPTAQRVDQARNLMCLHLDADPRNKYTVHPLTLTISYTYKDNLHPIPSHPIPSHHSIASVVELACPTRSNRVQVVVALDGPSLSRLHRAWSAFPEPWSAPISGRRCQPTIAAVATVSVLPVIGARPVVETMSASSHRP